MEEKIFLGYFVVDWYVDSIPQTKIFLFPCCFRINVFKSRLLTIGDDYGKLKDRSNEYDMEYFVGNHGRKQMVAKVVKNSSAVKITM